MKESFPVTPVLIGLCGAFGMVLLLYFGGSDGSVKQVQNAAIGTRILGPWLRAGGIAVEESNPNLSPRPSDLSLRIMPLYDMDLTTEADAPTTRKAAFEASTLIDMPGWVYDAKIRELPSLVILPKWRQGILAVEVAHQASLIPPGEYPDLFQQLGLGSAKLIRGGGQMTVGGTAVGDRITLFHAQVFDPATLPPHCRSDVEMPVGALVIFCLHDGDTTIGQTDPPEDGTFFLSDPDLLNNHGLRLGGNAQASRNLVRRLAGTPETPVYLDLSTELLLATDEEDQASYYQRDLGDLGRLFEAPFSVLWAVLVIIMTVLLWRGSVTIIPRKARARLEGDEGGREHPGLAAAMAKARLLRLGGHDDQMVRAYVQSEILRVYRQALGRRPGRDSGENPMLIRLHAIWSRRDKTRADRLMADALALSGAVDRLPPAERSRKLNSFRENLEILTDENPDPGRISGSRLPTAR